MFKNSVKRGSLFLLSILSMFYILGCSGAKQVQSEYLNEGFKFSGGVSDWGKSLHYIEGEGISFGFKNDNDNLYLCLVSSDIKKMMKILNGGMKISLDPGNSTNKIFIQYPQKVDFEVMRANRLQGEENGIGNDMQERISNLISDQHEYSILDNNEKYLSTYQLNDENGFKVKMEYSNYQLVYQLKIPLNRNNKSQFFLNTAGSSKINVEFFTEKIEMPAMKNNMKESSGEDEMGGGQRGKGNRGNRGSHSPGNGERNSKMDNSPLKYSFEVTLGK
ncbi:MAG: hypothetical protein Q8903_05515 [Bacteroidota bacterium]|nr:hypothetical protein [Bacteroidota bacterium]